MFIDFEKIHNLDENHTYQFTLKHVKDVKTIKFLYLNSIFVYINFNETYKDKDRKVNYITIRLEVIDISEIEPYEYLDNISEPSSISPLVYASILGSNIFSPDLESSLNKPVLFLSNPNSTSIGKKIASYILPTPGIFLKASNID